MDLPCALAPVQDANSEVTDTDESDKDEDVDETETDMLDPD